MKTCVVLFVVLAFAGCKSRPDSFSLKEGPVHANGAPVKKPGVDRNPSRPSLADDVAKVTTPAGEGLALAGGCLCPEALVKCQDLSGYAEAMADSNACVLTVSPKICAGWNHDGETIQTKFLFWKSSEVLAAEDYNTLYVMCVLRHEVQHLCEPKFPHCQTEQSAFNAQVACVLQYYEANCQDDESAGFCQNVAGDYFFAKAGESINGCKCQNGQKQQCIDACAVNYYKDDCQLMADTYFDGIM